MEKRAVVVQHAIAVVQPDTGFVRMLDDARRAGMLNAHDHATAFADHAGLDLESDAGDHGIDVRQAAEKLAEAGGCLGRVDRIVGEHPAGAQFSERELRESVLQTEVVGSGNRADAVRAGQSYQHGVASVDVVGLQFFRSTEVEELARGVARWVFR